MMHTTHMMHMTQRPSDGVPLLQDGDTAFPTLEWGPTPQPPRPRVTATAKIIQREAFECTFQCSGFSHFPTLAHALS